MAKLLISCTRVSPTKIKIIIMIIIVIVKVYPTPCVGVIYYS